MLLKSIYSRSHVIKWNPNSETHTTTYLFDELKWVSQTHNMSKILCFSTPRKRKRTVSSAAKQQIKVVEDEDVDVFYINFHTHFTCYWNKMRSIRTDSLVKALKDLDFTHTAFTLKLWDDSVWSCVECKIQISS